MSVLCLFPIGKILCALASFKIFFVFGFLKFEYDMSTCSHFFIFTLFGIYEISEPVIRCLSLILKSLHLLSLQIFILFLSFLFFPCIYPFSNCPTVFGYSVSFFFSFFFFLSVFQFEKFLLTSSRSLVLSLSVSSVLMSPLKSFFLSFTEFLFSSIYFLFFLRLSISLLKLFICSYMLSTFLLRSLLY